MNFDLFNLDETANVKPIAKGKVLHELLSLNAAWWKNMGDKSIYEAFTSRLLIIGRSSTEVAESELLLLSEWATSAGYSFMRVHRFHVQLDLGDAVADLKLNYHDYEFYLQINGKPEKVFHRVSDVRPWLEERFQKR